MWNFIPAIISGIGSIAKGFFGVQEAKLDTINKSIEAISQSNMSASEREKAVASVIASETSSGTWLAATWRPMLMLILSVMVVAYCLGFTTVNMTKPLDSSSMISQLFELLKIGVMGYMPLRTVDKIVESLARNNTLKIILDALNKSK
jgi:hypothetical protein